MCACVYLFQGSKLTCFRVFVCASLLVFTSGDRSWDIAVIIQHVLNVHSIFACVCVFVLRKLGVKYEACKASLKKGDKFTVTTFKGNVSRQKNRLNYQKWMHLLNSAKTTTALIELDWHTGFSTLPLWNCTHRVLPFHCANLFYKTYTYTYT